MNSNTNRQKCFPYRSQGPNRCRNARCRAMTDGSPHPIPSPTSSKLQYSRAHPFQKLTRFSLMKAPLSPSVSYCRDLQVVSERLRIEPTLMPRDVTLSGSCTPYCCSNSSLSNTNKSFGGPGRNSFRFDNSTFSVQNKIYICIIDKDISNKCICIKHATYNFNHSLIQSYKTAANSLHSLHRQFLSIYFFLNLFCVHCFTLILMLPFKGAHLGSNKIDGKKLSPLNLFFQYLVHTFWAIMYTIIWNKEKGVPGSVFEINQFQKWTFMWGKLI